MQTHSALIFTALALLVAAMPSGAQAPPSGPPSSVPFGPAGGGSFTTAPAPPTPPGTRTPSGGVTTLPFDFKAPGDLTVPPVAAPRTVPDMDIAFPILREHDIEPRELLVAWPMQSAAAPDVARFTARYGVRPAELLQLPALRWTLALYRLPTTAAAAKLRQRLMRDYPRLLADFNTRYAAMGKPRLYSQASIGLASQNAADSTRSGRGVRVGILDGPVAAISAIGPAVTRSFLAPGEQPASAQHATAIATLIVGRDTNNDFSGVAPGAALHAGVILRARGAIEDTTTRSVVAGLDWLLQARVHVANLSFGGPPNRILAAAVYAVLERSVIIVAAAGNDGAEAEPVYPAAYPGVIAVTAIDARERIYERANRGSYVTISAPGVDVWTPDGSTGHYVTGTSFSAAIVTGAVTLALSTGGGSSPRALSARLCETAKDLGAPGNDPVFGCGLLQMHHVLSASR